MRDHARIVTIIMGTLTAAALLAFLFPTSTVAQSTAKAACIGCSVDGKTTPRGADGHPDLNGFWNDLRIADTRKFERGSDGSILFDFSTAFNDGKPCNDDSCQDPNQPSYKPEYMAKVRQVAATMYNGTSALDPQMDCRPMGIPRAGIGSMQVVQTPQQIAILYEGAPSSVFRIIYTDGRPHPADLDTTFMGDSIGHWEGDTLVVDVVGLNDETWLEGGARTRYTTLHSDKEHVIERWTRKGDMLTYEATVDDPVMFTKPWVITPRRVHHAGTPEKSTDALLETICTPEKEHFVPPTEADKPGCSYRCK